jgi:tRNA (mo5U34)-methyltransferase
MTMTDDKLRQRIAAIGFWYHAISLRPGITTPGWAPINPDFYKLPDDLTDKAVLDIGSWDGYWAFEALKRGASRVVAIDDFSDTLSDSDGVSRIQEWASFDLCAEALGYPRGIRLHRMRRSVYDTGILGPFEVIFLFGVLYHLRHPLLALDECFKGLRAGGELYLETAISDAYSPYLVSGGGHGPRVVMEFYPGAQYGNNSSNWWCPTLACLRAMLEAAGFVDIECWKIAEPKELPQHRGWAKARKP